MAVVEGVRHYKCGGGSAVGGKTIELYGGVGGGGGKNRIYRSGQ